MIPPALALCLAVAVAAGACGGGAATRADPALERDVDALVAHVQTRHVEPWHAVSRAEFLAAADRLRERAPELGPDGVLVETMRLLALLGERDGHSGIYPLDPAHSRPLRLYPLRLHGFADGLRVVGQVGGGDLVGARLLEVAGTPVSDVADAIRPLVPRDNRWSREARLAQWLVVAEVLHGLGIADSAERATFRFALPDGREVRRTLAPVPAPAYARAWRDLFHPMVPQGLPRRAQPPWLARRNEPAWVAVRDRGRAVYVAYNVTLGWTGELADRVTALARRPRVRGVVLDLRHNPGGDVGTYAPLLRALTSLPRGKRLVALVSRTTFSAAAVLLADLEAARPPVLVGEPTGGSPTLYGDPVAARLPHAGWNVHVPAVLWERAGGRARQSRAAFEPHVRVPLRWSDVAAGRDAALDAALRALRG